MPGSEVEVPTISGEWGKGKALLKVVQMFFAIADLVEVLHICPGYFTPWIYMWSLSEDSGFNPLWRIASVSRLVCGLEETEGLLFDISTPLLFWPFLTWMMHTVRSREREASAEQFTGKVRVFETNTQSNWNITQPTHKVLFPTRSAMGELLKVQKFPFGTAHKSTYVGWIGFGVQWDISAGGCGRELFSSGETRFPNIWVQVEVASSFSLGTVAMKVWPEPPV